MNSYGKCGTPSQSCGASNECKTKPKGCVPVRLWDCDDAQKACTVVLHDGWLYGVEVDTPPNEAVPLGHDNYTKAMTFDKAVAWIHSCVGGTTTTTDPVDPVDTSSSTTVDEGCGRRITTDDGESTLVQGTQYYERIQNGLGLWRVTSGDTYQVVAGATPVELEPIVLKKSDCCGDFGNGVMIVVQANAAIARVEGGVDDVVFGDYLMTSGFGVNRPGDPVKTGSLMDDSVNRAEPHPYVLPWDENGEVIITPRVLEFPDSASVEDAFFSVQVYSYGCVCSDFLPAAQ